MSESCRRELLIWESWILRQVAKRGVMSVIFKETSRKEFMDCSVFHVDTEYFEITNKSLIKHRTEIYIF